MEQEENPINTILDLASEEVKGWPEWMRSNDHRREMERIERKSWELPVQPVAQPSGA
jgi:hypothetical protein